MKTLYISDLDGTLLNSKTELTPEIIQRLNTLAKRGILFTAATARTYLTATQILSGVDWSVPLILMNGVMLYDIKKRQCLETEILPPDAVHLILECMKHNGITGFLYTLKDGEIVTWYEDFSNALMKSFYLERKEKYKKPFCQISSLSNIPPEFHPVYFCLCHKQEMLQPVYDALKADSRVNSFFYRDIYNDGYWYLEIASARASKFHAAQKLRRIVQADRVVGFGDNRNDLPLFRACDKCCAVENAMPEVKAAANYLIGSSEQGGVLDFIEKDCIE